mmetsp:Transcript_111789/g.219148  ORF Transcript_111789/g.219148 Transcript_111789/m.219148 type:complete len:219 (+) Transcript_111789:806-1462(+)
MDGETAIADGRRHGNAMPEQGSADVAARRVGQIAPILGYNHGTKHFSGCNPAVARGLRPAHDLAIHGRVVVLAAQRLRPVAWHDELLNHLSDLHTAVHGLDDGLALLVHGPGVAVRDRGAIVDVHLIRIICLLRWSNLTLHDFNRVVVRSVDPLLGASFVLACAGRYRAVKAAAAALAAEEQGSRQSVRFELRRAGEGQERSGQSGQGQGASHGQSDK